jgi:predicted aspartyl protease
VALGTAALVVGLLAGACGGPRARSVLVEPEVTFALPPATAGCAAATAPPGGGARVPMTVSKVAGQVAELVNVCIGGRGPYAFVLDTGAGESTIDAGLARRLHLPVAGQSTLFAGVGCTGTAQPVSVGAWSLDGVELLPQDLTSATLPQIGGAREPVGLLGSDVLARFGGVRVDFDSGVLVLPGPEGAPLPKSGTYTGPVGPPPDPVLTQGGGTTVPLTVQPLPGDISLNVAVRFAGGPRRRFVVDTGSSQSVVASTAARAASLKSTDLAQRQATVCSVITVPLVHSGPWSVPGQPLHPQLVGETDLGVSLGGTQGLLGSDQLRRYGWVVLDFTGARMVLG